MTYKLSYKLYWKEKDIDGLNFLTISNRKTLPKKDDILSVVISKKRTKVKVLEVREGGYSFMDDYFDVIVQVLSN